MSSSSIIGAVIERLNQQLILTGVVRKAYGIAAKGDRVKDKADYVVYIGDGQAVPVTDFDKWIGSSFWIRAGQTSISRAPAASNFKSCSTLEDYAFPLKLVTVVQKSELPCDVDTAPDSVAQEIIKKLAGELKNSDVGFGAQDIQVDPRGYIDSLPGLVLPYQYAVVVIDFVIRIRIDSSCIPELCEGLIIPPVGCLPGLIVINGVNFGSVVSGGTLEIPVKDTDGVSVGEKIGTEWIVPKGQGDPATAVLKDTDGNVLSTTQIDCGDTEDIIAPDGAIELNGVSVGSVLSGGTKDIPVEYENGNPVGSLVGNVWTIPDVPVCEDAELEINGTPVASIASGATRNQLVQYVNGAPVGSLSGAIWQVPDPIKDLITSVQFDSGAVLDYTITIDADTAGTYTTAAFSGGMASATYQKNGVGATLPITVVATDTLRIVPNAAGVIKLSGTYP
jgi:hypothetical protein